jgi:hypothetical protein
MMMGAPLVTFRTNPERLTRVVRADITPVDHVVVNGVPPTEEWAPGTGTYTVNPDCTGAAVLHTSFNPEVKLHFVVVRHGTEIHQVVDANAVTAIGIKVK